MRRIVAILAGAVIALAPTPASADSSSHAATGQNLPPLAATSTYAAGPGFATQIRAYQASGQFAKDRDGVVGKATQFLRSWLRDTCPRTPGCKPAIVFDIDDTLVSWYPIYDATDFAYNANVADTAKQDCLTPKIRSTARLYDLAKRLGVEPFLITGRAEPDRAVTVACLKQLGITGYRELIMRGPDQLSETALAYKSAARRDIEQRGWDISLAIGDQVSDSAGGATDGEFVLPNPMYFIP